VQFFLFWVGEWLGAGGGRGRSVGWSKMVELERF
jgi:hypothetical protein